MAILLINDTNVDKFNHSYEIFLRQATYQFENPQKQHQTHANCALFLVRAIVRTIKNDFALKYSVFLCIIPRNRIDWLWKQKNECQFSPVNKPKFMAEEWAPNVIGVWESPEWTDEARREKGLAKKRDKQKCTKWRERRERWGGNQSPL